MAQKVLDEGGFLDYSERGAAAMRLFVDELSDGVPITIGTFLIPTGIILETIADAIGARNRLIEDIDALVSGLVEAAMADYKPSMIFTRWNGDGRNKTGLINFVAAEVMRQGAREKFARYIAKVVLIKLSVNPSLSEEIRDILSKDLETKSNVLKPLFFAIKREVYEFIDKNRPN